MLRRVPFEPLSLFRKALRPTATSLALFPQQRFSSSAKNPKIDILGPDDDVHKVSKSPEGWRVYQSLYPSVLPEVEQHSSLCEFMFGRWDREPNHTAMIQHETKRQLTFAETRKMTEAAASVLYYGHNIRKGDVVCIALLNNIFYAPFTYGIMRLGAVVTTANAITTPETLCFQLEASNTKTIVSSRIFQKTMEDAAVMIKKSTGKAISVLYIEDFDKIADQASALPSNYTAMEEAKPDDVVFLPFSSGTTGTPKGAQLTNKNLTACIIQCSSPSSFDTSQVFLSILPFFHIYGFTVVMSIVLAGNATQIIMSRYMVEEYLDNVKQHKVTHSFVAPPVVISLVNKLEAPGNEYDFSSMRYMLCGAAPLSEDVGRRMAKVNPNLKLAQGWGMTEMSTAVTTCPDNQPTIDYRIPGCLIPDTEMRVVKVDDNQQSGADKSRGVDVENEGDEGELWVKGPQLMKGYLDKEQTDVTMHEGWYRTGDMGYIGKRKEVFISGRLKELIKYKGFQVSPPEVEAELIKHPWVQDCIVIGVNDPRDVSFENPRALVVLKPDLPTKDAVRASDEIYRYMMRKMPPHKRLHGGVRIVESIMKNATGKLMRRQVRDAELEYMKGEGKE
ncbi:AMP-binding enzyme/AMP-binding enzyme C-terminal domain containing protein, putative [Angomonas deanei]|uniref:AMP-binding enzyme/AMP-binding enzyme C-terminal domain containing protein, putative n=1 Tax=Angomonas deanei TaxID=59799 RepID=A0A7G2CFB8_9TRYP|nr:AMP-binding enzyme/AMP-binding enzyme C-terminal domain containing protein, putative [Angomonas deanei]